MKNVVTASGRSVSAWAVVMIHLMFLFVSATASATAAPHIPKLPGIWLSQDAEHKMTPQNQEQLEKSLRRITGLPELQFTEDGKLVPGDLLSAAEGSATARQILLCALGSRFVFIIEDHRSSPSVNFGQMDEGMNYEDMMARCQLLIWGVRLDFDDFREMRASPEVRDSFDAGFTMLHELLHGLGYRDAKELEEVGQCEELINQARKELELPVRDRYFGEPIRIAPTVLTVRLRFSSKAKIEESSPVRSSRRRLHYVFFLVSPEPKP